MTEKLKILSPYDESLISEMEMNDASQMEHALEQAHRLANHPDERLSASRRIEILEHTALLVQERSEPDGRLTEKLCGDARVENVDGMKSVVPIEHAQIVVSVVKYDFSFFLREDPSERVQFRHHHRIDDGGLLVGAELNEIDAVEVPMV